jgi:hypothetical protein
MTTRTADADTLEKGRRLARSQMPMSGSNARGLAGPFAVTIAHLNEQDSSKETDAA